MKLENGFKGDERRKNGKVRLSLKDWIWVIVIIGGIIGTWTKFYYSTNIGMTAMAENCEANTIINKSQDKIIGVIQNDIGTMKIDIEQIFTSQQENQKLLFRILGVLDKTP